jgi:hypothetical protein
MNLAELRTHTPLINKKKEKKARKPIKKVAKKRAALNREYMKLRDAFLKSHPWCWWWMLQNGYQESDVRENGCVICNYTNSLILVPLATEIHHKKGRGKYLNDTSTWMAVSAAGHRAIHANPKLSYERGYMLPRR